MESCQIVAGLSYFFVLSGTEYLPDAMKLPFSSATQRKLNLHAPLAGDCGITSNAYNGWKEREKGELHSLLHAKVTRFRGGPVAAHRKQVRNVLSGIECSFNRLVLSNYMSAASLNCAVEFAFLIRTHRQIFKSASAEKVIFHRMNLWALNIANCSAVGLQKLRQVLQQLKNSCRQPLCAVLRGTLRWSSRD